MPPRPPALSRRFAVMYDDAHDPMAARLNDPCKDPS
jgi:hypothetical protein